MMRIRQFNFLSFHVEVVANGQNYDRGCPLPSPLFNTAPASVHAAHSASVKRKTVTLKLKNSNTRLETY